MNGRTGKIGTRRGSIRPEAACAPQHLSPPGNNLELGQRGVMKTNNSCDVAVIGAGPYGLSLAAHLAEAGISFRIFGKPLDTWRAHMPKDMLLKSEGFASNLSTPSGNSTLKAYCTARHIPYADQGQPVKLSVFVEYADWFRRRHVPMLEEHNVVSLERDGDCFTLELETGERIAARNVVAAAGITSFKHMPENLTHLPGWALSHSYDHHDVSQFKGKDVTVLGAGASAIDLAALLQDSGANVRILTHANSIRFHDKPDLGDSSLLKQIQMPSTGIGPGWRSFFCAKTPLLFHKMPEQFRLQVTKRHLGPAPGWFMRERVAGRIPTLLGYNIAQATAQDSRVVLEIADRFGNKAKTNTDHVIAATGYRPSIARLPFLASDLRSRIATLQDAPVLSDNFETTEQGLFFIGPAAANSFGPLMRFMVGSEFAAPRVAAHLRRKLGAARTRAAA
jgi:hypothetical protein